MSVLVLPCLAFVSFISIDIRVSDKVAKKKKRIAKHLRYPPLAMNDD